jgi:hypothetical protein
LRGNGKIFLPILELGLTGPGTDSAKQNQEKKEAGWIHGSSILLSATANQPWPMCQDLP